MTSPRGFLPSSQRNQCRGLFRSLSSLEAVNLMKLLSAQLGQSQQRAMPLVPCKQTTGKTLLFFFTWPVKNSSVHTDV